VNEEFSTGVKIILDRIKEFPDDFINAFSPNSRWGKLADHIIREKDTFTDEERRAVRTALRDARRADFDGKVIGTLAEPAQQDRKKILISKSLMTAAEKIMNDEFTKAYGLATPKAEGEQV
jgi:hypothetical protein